VASSKRYRPVRTALWALYLTAVAAVIAMVSVSLIGAIISERKLAGASSGATDRASCAAELGNIYREIHTQLDTDRARPEGDEGQSYSGWAPIRARLAALGERCRLRATPADPLSRAYQRVVALQRLSESAAIQYSHEVGPTDLEARALLSDAGAKLQ
jgi:hypothetical protein